MPVDSNPAEYSTSTIFSASELDSSDCSVSFLSADDTSEISASISTIFSSEDSNDDPDCFTNTKCQSLSLLPAVFVANESDPEENSASSEQQHVASELDLSYTEEVHSKQPVLNVPMFLDWSHTFSSKAELLNCLCPSI